MKYIIGVITIRKPMMNHERKSLSIFMMINHTCGHASHSAHAMDQTYVDTKQHD